MRHTPTDMPLAPGRPAAVHPGWGGFVLATGARDVVHVRLTGVLAASTVPQLDHAVRRTARGDATAFVLLHAAALTHVALPAVHALHRCETGWRRWGAVTAWVAPSPYVTQLLRLAAGAEGLPVLPDLATALRAADELAGLPAGRARAQLEVWGAPAH